MTEIQEKSYIEELMRKARTAQAVYAESSQKQLNRVSRACAKTVYDNAELFAEEAVEETGMGTVEGKVLKQKAAMTAQWFYIKDKISKGVVGWEQGKIDKDCILKIAKPIGVVGAIMPSTNPTTTFGSNAMQALKCGNAIIICPHPRAKNVSLHCGNLMRKAITSLGAPADLVQVLEEPSIELTQVLMRSVDVVVATGGPGMVKAANSSGHPSFGVGQGNCQVCVDKGMQDSFDKLAEGAIISRSWDAGIPCTCEQTVIMPECDKDAIIAAFERHGAAVIEDEEAINKLRKELFLYDANAGDYILNRHTVGKSVQDLGKSIGIEIPADKKTILVKLKGYGKDEILCREKLCPVTGYITYSGDWSECIGIAKTNLLIEGAGHSSDIYTNSEENQRYAGLELPVCRLVVNNWNLTVGGDPYYTNGMVPTAGVGCGYWQNNSIGENFNYSYLLNYTRVIYTIPGKENPTDEEIWREDD